MNVSTDLMQSIVNYLQTRPWAEVNNLIAQIKAAHDEHLSEEQPAEVEEEEDPILPDDR